jgi:hypothetical protein
MHEWCLLSPTGIVLQIALTNVVTGPRTVPEDQPGAYWVPIEQVALYRLQHYEYWSLRP